MHGRTKADAKVARESNLTDPDGLVPIDGALPGTDRARPVRRAGRRQDER